MTASSQQTHATWRRRSVLAAAPLLLTGCGTGLRVGQPAPYSPPPPGIDELVRRDATVATARALGFAQALDAAAAVPGNPAVAKNLTLLVEQSRRCLVEQGRALRTTAENQKHGDAFDAATPSPSPAHPREAFAGFGASLAQLRDLYALASLQTSAPFARLCAAAGSWAAWATRRHQMIASALSVHAPNAPLPSDDALVPAREVPASDPPKAAPADEAKKLLPGAQENCYFAAYALEVIAAHSSGAARATAVAKSKAYAAKGATLGAVAQSLSLEPVARAAGYPLSFRPENPGERSRAEAHFARAARADGIALTAALGFNHRAAAVSHWLWASHSCADYEASLEALPALNKPA